MRPCECWYDCKYYENGWCHCLSEEVDKLSGDECDYYDDTEDDDLDYEN